MRVGRFAKTRRKRGSWLLAKASRRSDSGIPAFSSSCHAGSALGGAECIARPTEFLRHSQPPIFFGATAATATYPRRNRTRFTRNN